MEDWREDARGFDFENDPDALKKVICGIIWNAPLFVIGYVAMAVLSAL